MKRVIEYCYLFALHAIPAAVTSDLFPGVRLCLLAVTFGKIKREEVLESLNDPDV